MRFQIRTEVQGHYKSVMRRFDKQLFEALAPKYAKMEIITFTGSTTGDTVHLRFVKPFRADWKSVITEHGENGSAAYFVDEGVILPFGLVYWRHKHMVEKLSDTRSCIVDDITYRASNPLFTILLLPILYLGFYPRKQIYKRYFKT